ncbi:MAG: hypothetical protein A2X45_13335 [Lentisphaerae bacterium GWF2_50_93]|nr:MAG: hypothetical protein A2X45_13335 [Lentisphaerae bacterium GWF2_50_93]
MNGNNVDIGKKKAGGEYLVMLPLTVDEELVVKEASTNCVCVTFLDFPKMLKKGETATAIVYFELDKPAKFNFELKLKTDKKDLIYKLSGETIAEGNAKKATAAPIQAINPVFLQRSPVEADDALYITVEKALKERPALKFVDIRPVSEFNECCIKDSMNLPVSLLKANPTFKDASIVLVDKGFYSEKMENACRELRKAGFEKTFILKGGLNAWIRNAGSFAGTKKDAEQIKMISPAELLLTRKFSQVLFVSCDAERPDAYLFPTLVLAGDAAGKITAKNQIVLVSSSASDTAGRLQDKLSGNCSAFILEGGVKAYRDFLLESTVMLNRGKVAQQSKVKNCGGCP